MKELLFTRPISQLMPAYNEFMANQPVPISHKFQNRICKSDAVRQCKENKLRSQPTLWTSIEEQNELEAKNAQTAIGIQPCTGREPPKCRKCLQPRKGTRKKHVVEAVLNT